MNRAYRMPLALALLLVATLARGAHAAGDSLAATDDTSARAVASAARPSAAPVSGPSAAARAAETPAVPESVVAAIRSAPVFLGGGQIFVVRAAREGLDPTQRAVAIRKRLDAAVADLDTPADSVWMHRTPEGVEVWLGQHYLWIVTHGDVERLSVPQLASLVSELPVRIRQGVQRERQRRSPTGLLASALIAIGITLLAWVLFRLVRAAGRRWRAFLAGALPRYLRGIRIGTFDVLSQGQMTGIGTGLLGSVDLVVGLLLFYGYLTAVFSLFPWSQGWSWRLLIFARDQLMIAALAIGGAIPGLLVLVFIFFLFRWLVRLSDRFFDAIDAGTLQVGWVHHDLARPTKRLVKILLWITALAIAYPYIPGSQSKAVQGISILLGVMVSLGSSGVVGNVVAGLVLTYSRSFSPGERVKIGEILGDVVNMGFFATKLRTPRNEEVTLPNGQVASQPILNYTRLAKERGLVLHTQVTIGYDADWRTVHRLLIEAAGRVEGVEREPAPWVFQRSLNDYHITYEICCATRDTHHQLLLYSRLHEEIQDAFAREGVEILSPAYAALRDANAVVLPKEPAGPRAAPGGFRIRPPEGGRG